MKRESVLSWLQGRKYVVLLSSVVLLIVLYPILRSQHFDKESLNILLSLVLAAAIFALSQRRRPFLLALVLGIPALSLTWGPNVAGAASETVYGSLVVVRFCAHLILLSYAAILILYDVLHGGPVTADKLCGSMCVYLLIGVIWAVLYSLIEYDSPGSFAVTQAALALDARNGSGYEAFATLEYFSFVTLTTLGFGDVTPASSAARTLTSFEAVLGQLYLAVMIARLVGLHIVHADQ
ncbi:MAG TPA: potassium channel family protein [Thermoguttaceae bacterium]|nr:potassium channel family protein [Thermoguttaceae bacterium]